MCGQSRLACSGGEGASSWVMSLGSGPEPLRCAVGLPGCRMGCLHRHRSCSGIVGTMDFVLGMVDAGVVGLGHRQPQLLEYVVLVRLLGSLLLLLRWEGLGLSHNLGLVLLLR